MTGVCVCVFVCLQAYLWKYTSDLYHFFCACYPWPWLGPPLVALQYKQVNNINSAKIKNRTKGALLPGACSGRLLAVLLLAIALTE